MALSMFRLPEVQLEQLMCWVQKGLMQEEIATQLNCHSVESWHGIGL